VEPLVPVRRRRRGLKSGSEQELSGSDLLLTEQEDESYGATALARRLERYGVTVTLACHTYLAL
jgi:hypothetical protein